MRRGLEGLGAVDGFVAVGAGVGLGRCGFWLIGLYSEFPMFLDVDVFAGDGRMSFFPGGFENLKLLGVVVFSEVAFVVAFDFGYSFELLDDFLVVAATLGSGAVMKVLFKSLKNLADSELMKEYFLLCLEENIS